MRLATDLQKKPSRLDAVVERILYVCVSSVLRSAGCEAAEAKALAHLAMVLERYIMYISTALQKHAGFAHRPSPTLVDVVQTLLGMKVSLSLEDMRAHPHLRIHTEPYDSVFPEDLSAGLCTYVDLPPYFYEFLPKFPPAHTFKSTPIKRRVVDDKSKKARIRNEQGIKAVDSLFRMMESSGTRPKRANYLLHK